jgi:hypothetical protein
MTLPAGITVDTATPMSANFPTGTAVVTDLSQLSDDTFKGNYAILVGAAQNDGTYKVACISNILKTEEAPVVYVPIKADASLEKGQAYDAAVNKIDLSTEGNIAATLADLAYLAKATSLGDVNGDYAVKANDAMEVYRTIINGGDALSNPAADVNGDNSVKANDAMEVYRIIIAGGN